MNFELGAVCLGSVGVTAAWKRYPRIKDGSLSRYQPSLSISQTSIIDEGVFMPAVDIYLTSVEALVALREAINQALLYDEPEKPGREDPLDVIFAQYHGDPK